MAENNLYILDKYNGISIIDTSQLLTISEIMQKPYHDYFVDWDFSGNYIAVAGMYTGVYLYKHEPLSTQTTFKNVFNLKNNRTNKHAINVENGTIYIIKKDKKYKVNGNFHNKR